MEKLSNIVIEKTGYFLKSYTLYKDRHIYDLNGWSLCINFSDGSTVESGGYGFEDAFPKLADDLMTYFVSFIRRSGTIMTNKKNHFFAKNT